MKWVWHGCLSIKDGCLKWGKWIFVKLFIHECPSGTFVKILYPWNISATWYTQLSLSALSLCIKYAWSLSLSLSLSPSFSFTYLLIHSFSLQFIASHPSELIATLLFTHRGGPLTLRFTTNNTLLNCCRFVLMSGHSIYSFIHACSTTCMYSKVYFHLWVRYM